MRTQTRLIGWGFVFFAFFAGLNGLAQRVDAQQSGQSREPLVLAVHGVGSTNLGDLVTGTDPRAEGWTNAVAQAYGVPVQEITFRYPGRTAGLSFIDAGYNAETWALQVQSQIQAAINANPGRRVIVVSHSWGTLSASLALGGGGTKSGGVQGIQGVTVDEWITLGSPIGDPRVSAPLLGGINLVDGKPGVVNQWTNFYDPSDPVSWPSQNLPGADNVGVVGYSRFRPISAHNGIWTNPAVIKFIKDRIVELRAPPKRKRTIADVDEIIAAWDREHPKPQVGGTTPTTPTTPVTPVKPVATELDYQPICISAMTAIEREKKETSQLVYGPQAQSKVDWVPAFTYDNGDCVGAFVVYGTTPPDFKKWWRTLEWAIDTGAGRMPVRDLIRQYKDVYPGLQWTATPRR